MFNIGEVEKFTGISKDRLRYYEEKGIIHPQKSQTNSYREYSEADLIKLLSIEYYRSMDLGMNEIREIQQNGTIDNLSNILQDKAEKIWNQLQELQNYHQVLLEGIDCCNHIKQNLNLFSIKPFGPYVILGELSDSKAFLEYPNLQDMKGKKTPIIQSMIREITFSDAQMLSNRMIIVDKVQDRKDENNSGREIKEYSTCLYTVVEEKVSGESDMQQVVQASKLWMQEHHYEYQGVVYVKPIVMTYPFGEQITYLGVYIPIF